MSAQRVVIDALEPAVDGGTYPAKAVVGRPVRIETVAFIDGHDFIQVHLLFRSKSSVWERLPMKSFGNDLWAVDFIPKVMGLHEFTVEAWTDEFGSWLDSFQKKANVGLLQEIDYADGVGLLQDLAVRSKKNEEDSQKFRLAQIWLDERSFDVTIKGSTQTAADLKVLHELAMRYPDPARKAQYKKLLPLWVDRDRAGFSAWYEFFPRSFGADPGKHGTFREAAGLLPYVADLGFDVVYLPPIHPLGIHFRKGKNNTLDSTPDDVGSPWAIGSPQGGHTDINPDLGSLNDFRYFQAVAKSLNLEVAMDIAFQCSPDHPWVQQHPEWFKHRADGSIQCAENPPKKYQDIYPLDFETPAWKSMWNHLKDVFVFWANEGVRIFRVDNPHTKSFHFWEWALKSLHEEFPDILFLAEAFTRPHLMQHLSKLGFSYSYTYFTWRSTKSELIAYLKELVGPELKKYFRPHFWPNTPDILPKELQGAKPTHFAIRLILAATLSPNYGIYGPAFELCENRPQDRGSEEYLNSEKYEIKQWPKLTPDSHLGLQDLIRDLNRIRRAHRALQGNEGLVFHEIHNDQILAYSKTAEDPGSQLLVVVNLDPEFRQSGWLHLDLNSLGLGEDESFYVIDLLSNEHYGWHGACNFVELDPQYSAAYIFKVLREPYGNA